MKKNKILIGLFSLCAILVVCVLVTTIVLASGTHNVQSSISIEYKAEDIKGGASACYTISGTTTNMTTTGASGGETRISFDTSDATTTQYLKPLTSKFTLVENTPIIFKYTFYNEGDAYYATLTNGFASQSALKITYSTDGSTYTSTVFNKATINAGDTNEPQTTILYIKVELGSVTEDVNCSGNFTWTLSKT